MEIKSVVRERGREKRMHLDAQQRQDFDGRMVARCQGELDWAHYERVMVFLPIVRLHEVNTWPLVRWLWKTRPAIEVYVPRVAGEAMGAVRAGPDTAFGEGAFGATEPAGGAVLGAGEELDLVLVPLLAFDASGHRVGYGRGYYDRFLAGHPEARRVGLGYECLMAPGGIAAEAHDVALQGVITEERMYRFD